MDITPEIKIAGLQAEVRYWKTRYELAQKYTKLVYLNRERNLLRVTPVPQPELGEEVVESGWFDVSVRGAVLKQIGAD